MLLNIDSLFESSIKLLDYLTKYYKFNAFLIDEIPSEKVIKLRKAIESEDKVQAVRLYLQLDKEMDRIRDEHCYKNPELPYRSNFRAKSKDLYKELKKRHLTNHDDVKYIAYILRFISTSDYYQIRDMLIKRSYTMYHHWDIFLNPDDYYCKYVPIEAVLDYCIRIACLFIEWEDEYDD